MTRRFNPPPTWPAPPAGWTPSQGWHPDPAWGPASSGWQLWVEDARGRTALQWVILSVVGFITLLFTIAGLATSGLGGGLLFAGLALLLTGTAALLVGRARWAFLSSRKAGAVAALAGLVAVGTAVAIAPAPPVDTVAASTPPAERAPSPSPTESEREPEPTAQTAAEPEREPQRDPNTGLLDASAAEAAVTSAEPATALAALARIEVKGRAPKTGYDRDQFGQAWADVDRNGCDTRNDILARDLTAETFKPGTRDCVVLTGTLVEPYSARTVTFQRGQGTSELVQIDHVVALSDAWQKGAQQWAPGKRRAFANDPLNLLAVDGRLNQQKGDSDGATWLPPNRGYRCAYPARQVAVKLVYGLWMTQAEKNATATVLSGCPEEPLPEGGMVHLAEVDAPREQATQSSASAPAAPAPTPTAPPPAVAAPPAPAPPAPPSVEAPPAPPPAPAPPPPAVTGGTDPRFGTCKAAIAAGYGPYVSGVDPEYDWYRDGDSDGVTCES